MLVLSLPFIALPGCKESGSDSSATPSARTRPSASAPVASASTSPEPASASSAAKARMIEEMDTRPPGFDPPKKPSKPPTVAEWNGASEVDVRNADALGCETKYVREWIRVSCRTNELHERRIKGLEFIKPVPKPANFYEFVDEGRVASVVFPLRTKTFARVKFQWSDFERTLTVRWHAKAEFPSVYFDKKSPADLSKPACSKVCNGPVYVNTACHRIHYCPNYYTCDMESGWCECKHYADGKCTLDY